MTWPPRHSPPPAIAIRPGRRRPRYTLASLATGKHTISVGAYNTATDEMCRYSASGPTQDEKMKPDVCAPAEEDAAGRGILCASSRRAQPTRMNGTSASAPHVTGLVALMFQFNRDRGGSALTADDIRAKIAGGAVAALTLRRRRCGGYWPIDIRRSMPDARTASDRATISAT